MKRFVLKKLFGSRRNFGYKKLIIWVLLFLVPGTQIVSFPVAYALTTGNGVSEVASVPSSNPVVNKEYVEGILNNATNAAAASAKASIFGIGENKAAAPSAVKSPEEVNDLVTLVVDSSLDSDPVTYLGLKNNYSGLSSSTLSERIERYAKDIVNNNQKTDVKLLFFDKSKDTVATLRDALENLYVNGDGLKNNRLAGIVLIGDIPMPVVNKAGNRFATVFPYTDFVDPVYTYDSATDTFVKNDSAENVKAEVWHGVITAPYEGLAGREYLAQYFDKNHLYYSGQQDFSEFDKKMFYADLIREKERLNKDVYPYYLRYLASLEDLAYYRFNKYWANELTQASMGGSEEGGEEESVGDMAQEQGVLTGLGEIALGVEEGGKSEQALNMMPDIQTKNVVDTSTRKYYQLLPKYISQLNDYVQYTGRYFGGDAKSTPGLISIKDQYSQQYLRNVNDALEKAVNEIAGEMENKVVLLKSTALTGEFPNGIEVEDQGTYKSFKVAGKDTLTIRFAYYNEVSGDYFLNGMNFDLIESPKQCAPFLGSTKENYYDDNNLFNPKREGVDGEYSIMTRSTRLDNLTTAQPSHTIGVNTRLVDPNTACSLSGGQKYNPEAGTCQTNPTTSSTTGAIIEDNNSAGISAFTQNYLVGAQNDYKNPFDGPLKKGDLIVEVNSIPISSAKSLEQAVEKVYKNAEIEVDCLTYDPATGECQKRSVASGPYAKLKLINITYYRGGNKALVQKKFRIEKKKIDENDQILLLKGLGSDGAIFTMREKLIPYDENNENGLDGLGYGDMGFDNAAGCLFIVNKSNTDKCFYRLATTPLFDPAGSVDLQDKNGALKFPENFPETPEEHFSVFQYPDDYNYEEIDEMYLDACYDGLPSFAKTNPDGTIRVNEDTNRFPFPLDKLSLGAAGSIPDYIGPEGPADPKNTDLYGRYLDAVGRFINLYSGDKFGADTDLSLLGAEGQKPLIDEVFRDIENYTGNDVILNSAVVDEITGNVLVPKVTLKMFMDHWGRFDGIDNNGNHIIDEAAESSYSADVRNMREFYRKYLTVAGSYTLPENLLPPIFNGTGGITLTVTPESAQEISSLILHNEPTAYTLMQQTKAMATQSLPIDNPRYVAFQNVEGNISTITYPNLFELPDYPHLTNELDALANQIAHLPGSYKLLGYAHKPVVYPYTQIKTAVLNNYLLPVVEAPTDVPDNGYDLTKANSNKIIDSLDWLNMGIDEKYQYVLTNYLNPEKDAYAADSELGYESAYLVMEGQSDYFQMSFNKDLPEETDPNFNPLAGPNPEDQQAQQDEEDQAKDEENGGEDEGADEGPWVWDWLTEELYPFIEDLQSIGQFEDACVYSEEEQGGGEGGVNSGGGGQMSGDDDDDTARVLSSIKLTSDPTEFELNGTVNLTAEALDQNGNNMGKDANGNVVFLKVNQSKDAQIFSESDTEARVFSNGFAHFKLKSFGVATPGTIVTATCPKGSCETDVKSDVTLKSAANTGKIITYVINQYSEDDVIPPEEPPAEPGNVVTNDEVNAITGPGEIIPPTVNQEPPKTPPEEKQVTDPPLAAEVINNMVELSWNTPDDNKDLVIGQTIYISSGECKDFSQLAYLDPDIQKYSTENLQPAEYCFKLTQKGKDGKESKGSTANATILTPQPNPPVAQDVFVPTEEPEDTTEVVLDPEDIGKIKILVSDPVNKITIYSTIVKDDQNNLEKVTFETWEDYYNATNYYEKFLEEPNTPTWEDHFIELDYYKKFLEEPAAAEVEPEASDVETPAEPDEPAVQPQSFTTSRRFAAVNIDLGTSTNDSANSDTGNVGSMNTKTSVVSSPSDKKPTGSFSDNKNPFVDADLNPYSKFLKIPGDEIVADAKSLMEISAQIYNSTGDMDVGVNHNVEFKLVPIDEEASATTVKAASKKPVPGEMPTFLKTPLVGVGLDNAIATTTTGEAKVYLKAGTKVGKYKVVVYLDKATEPLFDKEIRLVAGDPYYIEMTSPSYALIANGESRTTINFVVKDKYANVCSNSFDQIGVFSSSDNAHLDTEADLAENLPGIQLRSVEGKASVDLISDKSTGDVTVVAVLIDYDLEELFNQLKDDYDQIDFSKEVGTSKVFTVLKNAELKAELVYPNADKQYIRADNNSIVQIRTELITNDNGEYKRIAAYSGPINFTVVNDQMLADAKTGKNAIHKFMSQGALHEANVKLKSQTSAGEAEVFVEVPGFASKSLKVPVLAGPAYKIDLTSSEDTLFTCGEKIVTLQATVSDKYGNALTNDNSTSINFYPTDSTKDLISFIPTGTKVTATVVNGVATAKIKGKDKTGTVNLTAKINIPDPPVGQINLNPNEGLLTLPLVSRITKEEVKEFSPKALYVSLLGGSFGNFTDKNNIAQTLLYNGKTQAVSSITASPVDSKRMFYLEPNGKFELIDEGLEMKLIQTTPEFAFSRIVLSDPMAKKEVASIFMVPKAGTQLFYLDNGPKEEAASTETETETEEPAIDRAAQYAQEGIYLERLADADPKIEFKAGDNTSFGIFDEDGIEIFRIDKYGRVHIKDDKQIKLRLLSKDDPEEIQTGYLSFVVTVNGTDSGLVTFNQDFGTDVSILEYKSQATVFKSGVYIKYGSTLSKYGIIPALSGSSTAAPMGAYIVDTESLLDKQMAPGFAETSLEDANTADGVGFHGDNKNMLLFASGNSVGESNLPYGSEVGIIYGDPTVKLNVYKEDISDVTHFTKDIGTSLFTSKKEIKDMIKFDYDGDGTNDVLLVYEEGLMRLLKNEDSKKGFIDMGYVLNIYGGIFSMAKLDVNNDAFDDLVVGTKDVCIQGEECLSLFTNNNGNFVRTPLALDIEGKLLELKAADINNDGCDDLVTADTSGNIRVFYNKYESGQCKGLNNSYGYTKNFGFSMNADQNYVNELFVYYPNVEKFDALGYSNASKYIQFSLPSANPPAAPPLLDGEGNQISDPDHNAAVYAQKGTELKTLVENKEDAAYKTIPDKTYNKTYYFIHIGQDDTFNTGSSKYAVDVNGGVVQLDDKIEYTITLKNTSTANVNNMMVSTPLPSNLTLVDEKPMCMDDGCTDQLEWVDTGVTLRPKVITGISVPAQGTRRIKYTMQINTMPVVHFELGRDLAEYPSSVGDPYLDIRVRPTSNSNGIITHLYSTGVDSSGKVVYKVFEQNTKATLAQDKASILQQKYDKYALPDPTKVLEATNDANNPDNNPNAEFDKDENGNPKTDDSGNPVMDFLASLPTPSEDGASQAVSEHKSKTLGSSQKTLEQQASMMSQMLDTIVADNDFDGIPDNLDYSLFNPSFPENIQPVREALISSCNATLENAKAAYAGGGMDTDPSDGSVGASASYTPFGNEAAAIADSIENAMNQLRCNGAGCLPIPYNIALFAPDIIGVPPVPFGLPLFSAGSIPPWFAPMLPSPNWEDFRFYVIPTTTLGLVIAPCVIAGYGLCWPIAIPIASMTGCDKLVDAFLGAVMAGIDNVMADVESGTGGAISGGTGGDQEPPEDLPGSSQYNFPADSPVQGAVSFNVRIPGFPKVITDWIDQQTDEIYNKLLDFPDIYVIYPDVVKIERDPKTGEIKEKGGIKPGTFITSNIEPLTQEFEHLKDLKGKDAAKTLGVLMQTPEDLLRVINAMPLIQIEMKPVTIKIPMVSKRDWLRLKDEAAAWVKDWGGVKDQIEWYKEFYSCGDTGGGDETLCDQFILDITKLQKSIEKFMGDLEEFLRLPEKILEYRTALSKYAEQIVCYLDAIMKLFGAYVLKQIQIIAKWVQMVVEVIKMILSWKIILDLVIEFKVGCDECKNHRFSMLGLLLQLMVMIPTPPIIPLPKWPDLVFDFSQISTGIKIVWPEIKFEPEIIYPPHLPYFYVPKLFPKLKLDIPGFFVEFPKFEFPELPDLPPLPLPKLPDLPLPPKIPPLPDLIFQLALNLKPIFKILCLIMKALIPTFEWTLKTEAETLTQPNVNVVLMILSKLSISFPPITYDFVREVRSTLQMSFSANMDPIYTVVKSMTDDWNLNVRKLVVLANEATQFDLQGLIDQWLTEFYNAIIDSLLSAMGMCADTADPGAPGQETSFTLCIEQVTDEAGAQCEEQANQGEIGKNYCNSIIGTQAAQFLRANVPAGTTESSAVFKALIQKYDDMAKTGAIQPSVLPSNYQYTGEDYLQIPGGGDYLDNQEVEQLKKTLSYGPYKEFNEKMLTFDKLVNDYVDQMEDQYVPETYYLTATQEILQPNDPLLNKPLAEIEDGIIGENIPDLPEFNRVKELRDGMIAYTKELEDMNRLFDEGIENTEAIEKFIADSNASSEKLSQIIAKNNVDLSSSTTQVASIETPVNSSNPVVVKSSFFGENVENKVKEIAVESGFKIASTDGGMNQGDAYSSSTSSSSLTSVPKGFFVTDPESGENENVLRYTEELGGKTSALFMDVDGDSDTDIVYSMGGDVYVKYNHKKEPSIERGELLPTHIRNTVSDYLAPGGSRVNGVTSPSQNNEQADISWLSKGNVPAYEIILRKSLNDDIDTYAYRFVAVTGKATDPTNIELSSPEAPSISVKIENGNYYATVFALDSAGKRSVASEATIVAPQACADKEAPFPIASATELEVAIFKSAIVDASSSFDTNGKVTSYYLETLPYVPENYPDGTSKPFTNLPKYIWSDMDLFVDSNGDSLPANDMDNPVFRFGPFMNEGDIGKHEFLLHVADQSGNEATQSITVNVFVPNISLDSLVSKTGVAGGKTDPLVDEMPFALMKRSYLYRVMDGELKLIPYIQKIITKSARLNKKYYTDSKGAYEISDLNLADMVLVRNGKDEIVAEINPQTANVGIVKQGYKTEINEASPPQEPTHININASGSNETLAEIFVIADPNVEATIYQDFLFTSESVKSLFGGVYVSDTDAEDEFIFVDIPLNNPHMPGGVAVINKTQNKQAAAIDTSGNIFIIDPNIIIKKKRNNHVIDPLIIEMLYKDKVIAEIYISALQGDEKVIIVGPHDVPFQTPKAPSVESLYGNDLEGINFKSEIQNMIEDFFKKGLFEDIQNGYGPVFNQQQSIKRSEFVKVVLDMLCIIPRKPEAYLPYSKDEAGGGFSDITYSENNLVWYYPYVKEGALLGLVQGYLGETDENGLHPFKPDDTITRAEAVKIILEALQYKGIIDISSIVVDVTVEGWYWQYMEAAKDLTPFLKEPLANNFIITTEEGDKPEELMTYEQLFTMANRVLDVYNCYEEDKDDDGMSDFCEVKYGVKDPEADDDKDGLTNAQECAFGTDPTDKDTDGGGVLDGGEYDYGTDMLDPVDDPVDIDGDGLTDMSEKLIYLTDPDDPDTDKGGVKDGVEVLQNLTNPLDKTDDSKKNEPSEGVSGVYIVPEECNSCPCPSTLLHKADAVNGDTLFSVISNYAESQIFSKSNEVNIESLNDVNYEDLIKASANN